MATMQDLSQQIRDALLKEWDPIGIQPHEAAHDEYDLYVPVLCELLKRDASITEVFDYLWQLETEHMGLPGNKNRTTKFAGRLINIAKKIA